MRRLITLLAFVVIALAQPAYGATKLPIGCLTATVGQTAQSCPDAQLRWVALVDSALVLRVNSTGEQDDYNNATWRTYGSLAPSDRLWICNSDRTPGTYVDCGGNEGFVAKSTLIPPGPPPPPAYTEPRTFSWDKPTLNADGTPLTDLAGYRLARGRTPNVYIENVTLGLVTSHTFPALEEGQHCAGVYARDNDGNESARSAELCITITQPTDPPPPTCPPPTPADETQTVQCVSPQVGSWTQSRTYSCTTPPAWTAGPWTPATPPAGVCVTPPPTQQWRVAPIAAGTRPIYEAILNSGETMLVRGNQEGSVAVGTPCGNELFRLSTNSYRAIADAQAILNSPTYRGRQHAAICRLQ